MAAKLRPFPDLLLCLFLCLAQLGLCQSQAGRAALPSGASRIVDFSRDIAPLFRKSCLQCHGASKPMGGLRLDRKQAALEGGYSGPVIKPGDSAGSRLVQLVAGWNKN